MGIYAQNGILLADGAALRGCCCAPPPPPTECALVIARLWVSSYHVPPGSAVGEGSHSSKASLLGAVCGTEVFASRGSATWAEFYNSQNATTASCAGQSCDGATATAYNAGADMEVRVPWAQGNAQRVVAELTFDDSRIIAAGASVWVKWSLSVRFLSIGGGAPGPQTLVPFCRIGFTRGHTGIYETNGVDRTWSNIIYDQKTTGQTLTNLTARILLT